MRPEIRKIGEKELAAAVAFANRQFGLDFYRLQPKLYRCNGSGASYGCYVEDSLAGMLSVYPCEYKGLRCLSAGTVCTAPEFRGCGIMSCLFGYLEEAVFPDYDLLTLAGKRERYEHFGFAKALCFPQYQLSRKGDDRDIIICPVEDQREEDVLAELCDRYGNGVTRRPGSVTYTLNGAGHTLYLLRRGEAVSYAACRTEQFLIVEYGGSLPLMDAAAALARLWQRETVFLLGRYNCLEPELLRICDGYFLRSHGNIRINHPAKVAAALEGEESVGLSRSPLPLEETYSLLNWDSGRPPALRIPSSLVYLDGI